MMRCFTFRLSAFCLLAIATRAAATGFHFVEPAGWTVGDVDSTFQQWDANLDPENPGFDFAFLQTGTLPSDSAATPSLAESATMGAQTPGFPASSGGYYAFGGDYTVHADIFNHGGPAGTGGPYPGDYGTRVFVQTASTVSLGDISVFADSVEAVRDDGTPVTGGDNASMVQTTQLFVGDVETPIGVVSQEELLFEIWLPGHVDDFQVRFDVRQHSSFQHLRVDSRIEAAPSINPDFDGSLLVDGADFLLWQRDLASNGGAAGLQAWQSAFGTAPNSIAAADAVPEPATAMLVVLAALAGLGARRRYTSTGKGVY